MKKVLSNKNFSLIFFGNLVSSIGSSFYNFAISWYILELTGSAIHMAIYLATGLLIQLILTPFGGVIGDRYDKVKIVYITDFIRGLVIAAAGILIFGDIDLTTTLIILYICTIVLAINGALFSPTISSLQTVVVKREDLQTAQATMSLVRSLQGILGVLLAGMLYYALGVKWIFIINGLSYIFSGISEMFIDYKEEKRDNKLSITSTFEELKEGISYLRSIRGLLSLMICALFMNFAFTPIFSNGLPYLFEEVLKTSLFDLSLVEIGVSLGALIGGILIGNIGRNIRPKNAIYKGLTIMTGLFIIVTVLIYLMINNHISYYLFLYVLIFVMLLEGLVNMYVNIPMHTAFVKRIEPEFRGRAFGVINTLSMAATPLAVIIGGFILEYTSIVVLSSYCAVILIVITLVVLLNRSIKTFLNSYEPNPKETAEI